MFTRPDWKDPKAYSQLEQASLRRIAWEFLRRSPDYQKSWLEYASHVRRIAATDPEVMRYAELMLTPNRTQKMCDGVGSREELNALNSRLDHELGFFAEVPGKPHHFRPLDLQYGDRWGLEGMPHPGQQYFLLDVRFQRSGNIVRQPTSHSLKELEDEHKNNGEPGFFQLDSKWLVLQIDLTLPLEVIRDSIMGHIKHQREYRAKKGSIDPVKNRALPNRRYIEYLRILDGAAAGIAATAIGEVLAPKANNDPPERPRDKRFRAALKEAQRLQSEGYRVLPLLQQTRRASKKK